MTIISAKLIADSIGAIALAAATQVPSPDETYRVTNFLCSEPRYAAEYAAERAAGATEDVALNTVGKLAGKTVCGLYSGQATIAEQRTEILGGKVYLLTAWRFLDRHRRPVVAWIAEDKLSTSEMHAETAL